MIEITRTAILLAILVAGLQQSAICQEKPPAQEKNNSIASQRLEQPAYRGLDASLYMQTSAEYRACCFQAFRWAGLLAEQKLKERKNTEKPAAIVMDLDETLLDNGAYQADQIRSKYGFDSDSWSKWEDTGADRVRLVPGAKAFVEKIRQLGIQPVYVTNRNDRARAETMRALKRFGLEVPEDQLLCADNSTGSNKTSRRERIAGKFDVLLFVGDNLRDFDERFRFNPATGIDGRYAEVESASEKFGVEWIIIPNPSYGEWNRAFSNSLSDTDLLYK